MTNLSSSSRGGAQSSSRMSPTGPRLQVALFAAAAVVLVALVATAVVVLTGRGDAGTTPPTDRTGCSAMTRPVRYQLDPDARTGLFTTNPDDAAAATHAGYTRDYGIVFRVADSPTPGLVAVHQLRKGAGDQLWTTDPAELREATQAQGYADEGVAAYVSPVAAPCTVQVARFQLRGLHRYATTASQQDALRGAGWAPEGSFYAARPTPAETTPPRTVTPTPEPTPTRAPTPTPRADRQPEPGTVLDARFDDVRSGPVTPDSFIRAVGANNHDLAAYDSMTYVKQGDGSGSSFVRTHLAAHRILAGNHAKGDGNVLVVPLEDQSQDAACISYDVRFAPGFEVSAGGKLPGLLGVAPGVSPGSPTGGGSTAHGWSGRVMWLGPKLSKAARDSGQSDLAVTYLYHPGQNGTFGDQISWGRGLVDGDWHEVRQCYTLNTVGQTNGGLQAWVDGTEVLNLSDLVYRTDPSVHITHLDWSVFRGGDTADWAADSGGDVDLDNLRVTVG
jgi:hypothetical protein